MTDEPLFDQLDPADVDDSLREATRAAHRQMRADARSRPRIMGPTRDHGGIEVDELLAAAAIGRNALGYSWLLHNATVETRPGTEIIPAAFVDAFKDR